MNNKLDPETLKIPAYMRKKMIVSQARQKLILTALDRKQAKLPPNSKVAVAPFKGRGSAKTVLPGAPLSRSSFTKTALSRTPRAAARPYHPPSFSGKPETTGMTGELQFESQKSFPQIGRTTHYLEKIGVAIIMLSAPLKTGDHIIMEGDNELFIQKVEEMQIDRQPVNKAKKGAHIGLKTCRSAKVDGRIYRSS